MNIDNFHSILVFIQEGISLCGVLVILIGVLIALGRYIYYVFYSLTNSKFALNINIILD